MNLLYKCTEKRGERRERDGRKITERTERVSGEFCVRS